MKTLFIDKAKPSSRIKYKSYDEVLAWLDSCDTDSFVYTLCLEFFSFEYMDKCTVLLSMVNNCGEQIFITPKELLDNEYPEIGREIRRGHNIHKMLLAGVFDCIEGDPSYKEIINRGITDTIIGRVLTSNGNNFSIDDLICEHDWKNHSFDQYGFIMEYRCDQCGMIKDAE